MKRTLLLNRHLSALIATLGHLDEIIVADAGLPIPEGIRVIDLAVSAGLPGFFDVLNAIKTELAIEGAVYAEEASNELSDNVQSLLDDWSVETAKSIRSGTMSHEAFKTRSQTAKAIIRTGETTPYANVILISGVVF